MFHHFFVYVAPPTLGSKLPQQLFDGVGCYLCLCHQENVVFGQVGKIVFFFGCRELQWTQWICKLLPEIKIYWSNVKVFLNSWVIGSRIVTLKDKNCALWDQTWNLPKSLHRQGFSSKIFTRKNINYEKCPIVTKQIKMS